MIRKTLAVLLLTTGFGAGGLGTVANAQTMQNHTEGMTHDPSMMQSDPMMRTMDAGPTEPGQGAFAAVSEIVAILSADPMTDWSRVNINALREHLVDMDMLITNAQVTSTDIDGGIEMTIALGGLGGGAVGRMVPAHAPVLQGETGWQSEVTQEANAIVWRVASPQDTVKIRALGFFGLMAVGDHHRAHHMGMARGQMVH